MFQIEPKVSETVAVPVAAPRCGSAFESMLAIVVFAGIPVPVTYMPTIRSEVCARPSTVVLVCVAPLRVTASDRPCEMNFVEPPVTVVDVVSTVMRPVTTFGARPRSAWNVAAFAVTLYGRACAERQRRVAVHLLDVAEQHARVAVVGRREQPVPGATFALKPLGAVTAASRARR
jgi:hypothetical protein